MKEKLKSALIIGGISLVVIFGIFIGSCKNDKGIFEAATYSDMVATESVALRSSKSMMMSNGVNSSAGSVDLSNSFQSSENGQERKIIKTGSLSFEVKNLSETEDMISAWIEDFGGYVSNTWSNRNSINITAKVPAEKFEDAMAGSGNFGILLSRSISTEDVSENYYDLETRLETRRVLQEKLENYLANAKNISELLEIERQLNDVTSELESMEKQFRRLSNQIDFSTISISCSLPANTTEAGFETPDFIQGLKDFAYNALQFVCNFGIGILYIVLIGVPSVLLVALIYWLCFGKIGLIKKLFKKLK